MVLWVVLMVGWAAGRAGRRLGWAMGWVGWLDCWEERMGSTALSARRELLPKAQWSHFLRSSSQARITCMFRR